MSGWMQSKEPRSLGARAFRTAVAGVALLILLTTPGTVAGRASAQDAAQPAARSATVTLHTPLVDWAAEPGTAVEADLLRAGRVAATARAVAARDGSAALVLSSAQRGDAVVRPRDQLLLRAAAGVAITLTVPSLVVAPDPAAGRVVGRAQGASAVTVSLQGGSGIPEVLVPDASGAFAWPVGNGGLAPGRRGWAERESGGHRFRAEWVVFEAAVELSTPWLSGEATPGSRIALQHGQSAASGLTWTIVAGDGTREGRARFVLGARMAMGAGETIVVTETLALVPERTWRLVVPALDAAIDAGAERVTGQAPAGATVAVALRGPDGQVSDRVALADDTGRYSAAFAGLMPGPGWRAVATVGAGGLGARARASIPWVQARLYDARVDGVGLPHGEAAVSVLRPGESAVGPWRVATAPDGAFTIPMSIVAEGEARPLDVLPGDVLFVDLVGGDPVVIEVPHLTAVADAAADAVAGEAPPGTRLRVTARRDGAGTRATMAGADGRWSASWAGEVDLQPGDGGVAVAVMDGGHVVELPWAAIGIVVDLATGELAGNAPPNRVVTAVLSAPDGTPLGSASMVAERVEEGARWRTVVRDALGSVVPLAEGDRLAMTVGDAPFVLMVPPLAGVVHVADDLVSGRTRPSGRLEIAVARPEGAPGDEQPIAATTSADASGSFAASFAPDSPWPRDVRYNDRVTLALDDGPHRFVRALDAPGLVVDVGNGRVRGSLEPDIAVLAVLERQGRSVASRSIRTAADATFRVVLRGAGDTPPADGDAIVVSSEGALATRSLRLDVGQHSLMLDAAAGRASGRTVPGARLQLATHHAFGSAPDRGLEDVQTGADGSWSWSAGAPLAPGTRVMVRAVLPSGHILERSDTVPILSVQLNADRVCGRGAPLAPVALSVRDGLLLASGRADEDGAFALSLASADGSPALLAPTDRVRAEVGTVSTVAEPHGFHAAPDASGRGIQGVAENTDWVALFHPIGALDCRGTAEAAFPAPRDAYAPFADGRFRFVQLELSDWLPEGIELAWLDREDGHRRFWRSSPLHAWLHIHTDRVAGTVAPGTAIAIRVQRVDGLERGAGAAVGRPDGRFEARIAGSDGQPVRLAIGDAVTLDAAGASDPLALIVQRLDFDFARGRPILGEAPAQHPVDLQLFLTDGRRIDFALTADETGGWSIGPADVPVRAGWTLGDVVGVRAELPLAGGHAIVVESGSVDGLAGSGGQRTIFLPVGERP